MNNPDPVQEENVTREFERLQLLFEYTKFHVGLYATLTVGLAALLQLSDKRVSTDYTVVALVAVTVLLWVCAGFCGGVIASSINRFDSIRSFRSRPIGPGRRPRGTGLTWEKWEHRLFWVGVGFALAAFVRSSYIVLTKIG